MKLKAAVAHSTPDKLVRALENLRERVAQDVLAGPLGSPNYGPAEFYVQDCDYGDPSAGLFVEARLTGVSRRDDRNFEGALAALREVYVSTIKQNLKSGRHLQLMVTIMVDLEPVLYETAAEQVIGEDTSQ